MGGWSPRINETKHLIQIGEDFNSFALVQIGRFDEPYIINTMLDWQALFWSKSSLKLLES